MGWVWRLRHAIRFMRMAESRLEDRALRARLRELIDQAEDILEGKDIA